MQYANSTTTAFDNYNVAVGYEAYRGSAVPAANTGNYNTALGYQTLLNNTSGSSNVAHGYQALDLNTTGSENTAVGYLTDASVNNLTNATAIGARAVVGASNSIVLGSISGVNGATSSVKVGIGVQAPAAELEVNGYTKLGTDAPKIRMKKLTGTTASSEGAQVGVAHGLTSTKILSCVVMVEYTSGYFIHQGYTNSTEYQFNWVVTPTDVLVWNTSGNSGSILSDPFVVLLTYEE
jgi:hypothetical protein